MSNYRKVHISLLPENFQALRKFAFENETTLSAAIDFLIHEDLGEPEATPAPPESKADPQTPSERPTEWSAVSRLLK